MFRSFITNSATLWCTIAVLSMTLIANRSFVSFFRLKITRPYAPQLRVFSSVKSVIYTFWLVFNYYLAIAQDSKCDGKIEQLLNRTWSIFSKKSYSFDSLESKLLISSSRSDYWLLSFELNLFGAFYSHLVKFLTNIKSKNSENC